MKVFFIFQSQLGKWRNLNVSENHWIFPFRWHDDLLIARCQKVYFYAQIPRTLVCSELHLNVRRKFMINWYTWGIHTAYNTSIFTMPSVMYAPAKMWTIKYGWFWSAATNIIQSNCPISVRDLKTLQCLNSICIAQLPTNHSGIENVPEVIANRSPLSITGGINFYTANTLRRIWSS